MNAHRQSEGGVELHVAAPVAYVVIDRSVDSATALRALQAVGTRLPGDVRVVVVLGHWALEETDIVSGAPGPFDWLERPDVISIAAVQGPVTGPGFALALACDVRIAAVDAIFGVPALSRGLLPSIGIGSRIVDAVGYPHAFELCVLGVPLAADRAQQWGLVTATTAASELEEATNQLVTGLLALPRAATIETKALLQAANSTDRTGHPGVRVVSEDAAHRRLALERFGYAEG